MSRDINVLLRQLADDEKTLKEIAERIENAAADIPEALKTDLHERGIRRFWERQSGAMADDIGRTLRTAAQEAQGVTIRTSAALAMAEEVRKAQGLRSVS